MSCFIISYSITSLLRLGRACADAQRKAGSGMPAIGKIQVPEYQDHCGTAF
jgi:hypothetical protein